MPGTNRAIFLREADHHDNHGVQPVSKLQAHPYATRPTENSRRLEMHAAEIRKYRDRTLENLIAIGRHLIEARKLAAPGQWLSWLATEFDWSEASARNFMRIAADPQRVADLRLPVRSLYLLTAPSTPPAVRDAVVEKAKAGKVTTHRQVVETIRDARPERPRTVEIERRPEPKPAPMINGSAKSARVAPAGFADVVHTFAAITLHLFNRERLQALEHPLLPPELRQRVSKSRCG